MREKFDETYDKLRDASNRHAKLQSETDDFDELTASRAELDGARSENTTARRGIVRRRDYATPDAVPAGLGRDGLTARGKWAAGGGAVVFLALVAFLLIVLVKVAESDPLAINGDVVEQVDSDCGWQVAVPYVNNGDEALVIDELDVIIDQGRVPVWLPDEPLTLDPGESTVIEFERRMTPCPTTPGDVEHGRLWTKWRTAEAVANKPELSSTAFDQQFMRHSF